MSEKIWLQHYPDGVPATIQLHTYRSLADLFEQTCIKFSDKPAVSNFDSELTFTQLEKLSGDFASYLQHVLKLKKGERLAIMLPNILQYYVVLFAALRLGLVVVNANPLYTAPELKQQLADAEVSVIIVLANFAQVLQKVLLDIPIKHVIVTELGDLFGAAKSVVYNFVTRYIKKLVPPYHITAAIAFRQALRLGKSTAFEKIDLNQEDIAFLQYTGGTTGVPKGAILTHGNLLANIEQAYVWIKAAHLQEGEEIVIAPLPLYHIFSLTVCAFCFMKMGGKAVLITNPRDIPFLIKVLKRTPYTVLIGINTLLNALLQHPQFNQQTVAHLKLTVAGGMPLQKTVADQWCTITKTVVLEGYGLTEASPIVTINPVNLSGYNGSIGLPVPSTDVVIRDEQGRELAMGEEGEVCVKGPQVMKEYWRNPQETQKIFSADGWLLTGDMGRFDSQGFFYLLDRKKELILVSGFKIYPNEVENVLMQHPGVLEVAVIGVPSAASGEAIKAVIVKKDPKLTANELRDFCKEQLTPYKIPKIIEFVASLPKSTVGKILRRELK